MPSAAGALDPTIMLLAVLQWLMILALAFVGARWAGRTLDRHYNDAREVAGVVVLCACVLGPLVAATMVAPRAVPDLVLRGALLLVIVGGLFAPRETA